MMFPLTSVIIIAYHNTMYHVGSNNVDSICIYLCIYVHLPNLCSLICSHQQVNVSLLYDGSWISWPLKSRQGGVQPCREGSWPWFPKSDFVATQVQSSNHPCTSEKFPGSSFWQNLTSLGKTSNVELKFNFLGVEHGLRMTQISQFVQIIELLLNYYWTTIELLLNYYWT